MNNMAKKENQQNKRPRPKIEIPFSPTVGVLGKSGYYFIYLQLNETILALNL